MAPFALCCTGFVLFRNESPRDVTYEAIRSGCVFDLYLDSCLGGAIADAGAGHQISAGMVHDSRPAYWLVMVYTVVAPVAK